LTSNTMGHDFARKCDRQISLRVLWRVWQWRTWA
jgi:hypothetical protein